MALRAEAGIHSRRGLTDPEVDEVRLWSSPGFFRVPSALSERDVVPVRGYMVVEHTLPLPLARPSHLSWFTRVLPGVLEMTRLPTNWDGYGGQALRPQVARFAIGLLLQLLSDEAPQPALVPTSEGGLSVEWHTTSADLVIDIPPRESVLVYFKDHSAGTSWERELSSAIGELDSAISRLSGDV